jgi:N-acetylneuraminic acid mutarotase
VTVAFWVAGGDASEEEPRFTSAEVFDPSTGHWTIAGDMTTGRSEVEYAGVYLLADGRVLVPGGFTANETPVLSADVYDPNTGTWSAAGFMSTPRAGHSAVVLPSSVVLVMGGLDSPRAATTSVDLAVEPSADTQVPPTPPPRP